MMIDDTAASTQPSAVIGLRQPLCLACAAGMLAAAPAFAHHSPAAYDVTAEIVVEGTITKVDWANPHVYFTLETAGPDGGLVLQQVEAVSIAGAQSAGLRREYLALGSTVTVRAHPNRRGIGYTVLGADVTTSDGSTYPLGGTGRSSRAPTAIVAAKSLAGSWTPKPDPLLVPKVHGWPITDKAREAIAAIMSGATVLSVGCTAVPPPMLTQLPQLRTIEIGDDTIVMRVDADGNEAVRRIHIDLAEHPHGLAPTLFGHSIGRWEDGTLVIDTVGFAPHPTGVGFGIPSSPGKHLVERLTLTADKLQLRYELTIEDPEYLAAPASYSALWDHRPELDPSGAACDPEIARRFLAEE